MTLTLLIELWTILILEKKECKERLKAPIYIYIILFFFFLFFCYFTNFFSGSWVHSISQFCWLKIFFITLRKKGSCPPKITTPCILLKKWVNRELCRRGVGLRVNRSMNRSMNRRTLETWTRAPDQQRICYRRKLVKTGEKKITGEKTPRS